MPIGREGDLVVFGCEDPFDEQSNGRIVIDHENADVSCPSGR
jgi:hypothetical protein